MNLLSSALMVVGGAALAFGILDGKLTVLDVENGTTVCPPVPIVNKEVCLLVNQAYEKVMMTMHGVRDAVYYFDTDIMAFVPVPDGAVELHDGDVWYCASYDGLLEA